MSREQELRDLLPDREWRPCTSVNWEDFLTPPSKQLTDVVPGTSGGTCAIQTYAEALTAHMRRFAGSTDFKVNLPDLIRLAWAKGFLRNTGSSVAAMGKKFGKEYGVPLEGTVPDRMVEQMHLSVGEAYFVLGTTVEAYESDPLPFGSLTAATAGDSMDYREHLCSSLDNGPVVLCMDVQDHYAVARGEGEPFRRRDIETQGGLINHCVTAYGYDCEDGTVRTLRIIYQENATGAPVDEPQRGLYIDPDAIDSYYVLNISGMHLNNAPAEGYQRVHLSPARSTPPPPPPPPPSIWGRIRGLFSSNRS